MKKATFLILSRDSHYGLSHDGFNIDKRLEGVCDDCLVDKNEFQKSNTQDIYADDKHLTNRYL